MAPVSTVDSVDRGSLGYRSGHSSEREAVGPPENGAEGN